MKLKPPPDEVKGRSIMSIFSRSSNPAQSDVTTACLAVLGTDSETEGEEEIPVTGMQLEDDLYSTGESSAVNLEYVTSNLTSRNSSSYRS